MLKLVLLSLFVFNLAQAAVFTCPTTAITVGTLGGNLPVGATNITNVPKGTNCTFVFDIPNNYMLLLKFSADFQSDNDTVLIFDNKNQAKYRLVHTGKVIYENPLWMPARSTQVQVVGVSGNSRFMLSYMYQSLSDYQQVTKHTGDYFPASSITGKTYYTITASSPNEKVVLNYAQRAGAAKDGLLSEYYVYDGDNINTAMMIGSLSEIGSQITVSFGKSISIVNLYGTRSSSYILGNDASTVKGFSKYTVVMTSLGSGITGQMTDLYGQGTAFTFICTDCSTFYWTRLTMTDLTLSGISAASATFQGQTPTHRREKLINYEPRTFTSNQLPQMLPTNIFTIVTKMASVGFDLNTYNDDSGWKRPYIGRKGYIFSPNLWSSSATNSFNYEFRNDSQLYSFTLNMNKMAFPLSSDQMTLKIGASSGTPAINNVYPRDQSSNGKVMSNGNYMQVGLSASVGADVRLSFEIQKTSSAVVIGVLSSILLTLFYTF